MHPLTPHALTCNIQVLDAHIEELIRECKEEVNLIPLMSGAWEQV